MGSSSHYRLLTWFDEGAASGRFAVPSGRHIILNEFPRLMKETRLLATAGVDAEDLRSFFQAINPVVETLVDVSPEGIKRRLLLERGAIPALRNAVISIAPTQRAERWFVYMPPLRTLRAGWQDVKRQLI